MSIINPKTAFCPPLLKLYSVLFVSILPGAFCGQAQDSPQKLSLNELYELRERFRALTRPLYMVVKNAEDLQSSTLLRTRKADEMSAFWPADLRSFFVLWL